MGLTLHPLFPLAFLFVLLLEFGYQARVHIPGLRNGTLLVLFYTGEQNQTERLLRNCPGQSSNVARDSTDYAFILSWRFQILQPPKSVARTRLLYASVLKTHSHPHNDFLLVQIDASLGCLLSCL